MDAECRRLDALVLMQRACRSIVCLAALILVAASHVSAQIRVNPTGVNVSAQGSTSVFLTFGGLDGYVPVEALWCGELVPATNAIGMQCAPGSVFGQLPLRFDQSRASGTNAFTDIMTIPPSVARRAYQDAVAGANSAFFYVRRFRSLTGDVDQYVAVTCRLTGGGARTPLSLTDVTIAFNSNKPVLQVATGELLPAIDAHIAYTGTGRLTGRWEVVLPGEEMPSRFDLLTEASLPLEERPKQRRYTQLARFNVFLPPTGRVVLPAPDPRRFPTATDGVYHLLLRIEASSDKEGDSNLGAVGAGDGVVHSGAVAGFAMPMLRYVVGSGASVSDEDLRSGTSVALLLPHSNTTVSDSSIVFRWRKLEQAVAYRLEAVHVETGATAGAVLASSNTHYDTPAWFRQQVGPGSVRWRVIAVDAFGRQLGVSPWWNLQW